MHLQLAASWCVQSTAAKVKGLATVGAPTAAAAAAAAQNALRAGLPALSPACRGPAK